MQPALHKRIGSAKGAPNHSCFANLLVRVFLSHRTLTPLVRVIARVAIINQSALSVPILLTYLLLPLVAYHCTTFLVRALLVLLLRRLLLSSLFFRVLSCHVVASSSRLPSLRCHSSVTALTRLPNLNMYPCPPRHMHQKGNQI